jgi:hypothetical protein
VVASGSGYLSGSSLRQHFGLGDADTVDEVEISWPSGLRSRLRSLSANRAYHVVEEAELGSDETASAQADSFGPLANETLPSAVNP